MTMEPGSLIGWARVAVTDSSLKDDGPLKARARQVMEIADMAERQIASLNSREQDLIDESKRIGAEMAEVAAERVAWATIVAKMSAAPAAVPAVAKPGRTRKAKAEPAPEQTADFALVIPAALDRRAAE